MTHIRIRLVVCLLVSTVAHALFMFDGFWGLDAPDVERRMGLSARLVQEQVAAIVPAEATPDVRGLASGLPRGESGVSSSAAVSQPTGESSLFVPSIENYLPVSLLTEVPSPIDSVDPTPPGVKLEGSVGELELILLISSEGGVDAVLTVRSSLPQFFADYAKSTFLQARFTPGLVNRTAVRSRVRVFLSPNPTTVDPETGNPLSAKNRRR